MNWIAPTASFLEILLLLYVAMIDIATRLIRNEICLVLALLGIASQFASPMQVTESLIAATILLLLLIVIYQRGWIGGGDVKLLVALAIGLPLMGVIQLLTITALAGGVLALVHLMMRLLPYPKLAPAGSSLVRRVYAIERWRNLRHAPLPYGVAIACGGIWTVYSAKDSDMSSTLRLSIIMVLLLATAALGLIAYNMNLPKPVVQVTENTPVACHCRVLCRGTSATGRYIGTRRRFRSTLGAVR